MTKRCGRCGEHKPCSEFYKRNKSKDGLNTWCKPCHAAHSRERYRKADKQRKQQNARIRREINREYVWNYLESHPCVDCGEADPVVLEFDHLDPELKTAHVSKLISESGVKRIAEEIAKCDVRCANCHKRITYIRAGSWRVTRNIDGI